MILKLPADQPVFACAPDINKLLVLIFGPAPVPADALNCPEHTVIALTKFESSEATQVINLKNPSSYSGRVRALEFWAAVRGSVKAEKGAFPHLLKPELYKEPAAFLESIPSKHAQLILTGDEEDTGLTVKELIAQITASASAAGCQVYGVFREEVSCGATSERPNLSRKIIHMLISQELPSYETKAAIAINLAIVEGRL